MAKKSNSLLIIVFLFSFSFAHAQVQKSPTKNNLWTRYAVSYNFTKKFRFETEFQYRSQNVTSDSPLEANLLKTIRLNGFYQLNSSLMLSFSPFARFYQYQPIYDKADKLISPKSENRFALGLENTSQLVDKLSFANRISVEYRDFLQRPNRIRTRLRLMLKYTFSEKVFVNFYDELFTNISGVDRGGFFDQNRIGLYLNVKPYSKLKIETGYMYANRYNNSLKLDQPENNLILHLYYQIN